jgi:hypothetical protein
MYEGFLTYMYVQTRDFMKTNQKCVNSLNVGIYVNCEDNTKMINHEF